LELHLKELRPNEEVLKEVSELNEVLIGLGYLNDARKLQTSLDSILKLQKVRSKCENDVTFVSSRLVVQQEVKNFVGNGIFYELFNFHFEGKFRVRENDVLVSSLHCVVIVVVFNIA